MEPLLTLNEVASALRVTRSCLYRWLAKGKFPPPIAVGRYKRWRREDVEQYLAQNRQPSTQGEPYASAS